MRRRDVRVSVADALKACETIEEFMRGRALSDYRGDRMLRAAVERQFEILGEALNRALQTDPGLADRLPEAPEVIGFRNVLAHHYDVVSDETVYNNATTSLPVLLSKLKDLLAELRR
jgi:uncharacterized protein with HEPN domain